MNKTVYIVLKMWFYGQSKAKFFTYTYTFMKMGTCLYAINTPVVAVLEVWIFGVQLQSSMLGYCEASIIKLSAKRKYSTQDRNIIS